MDPEYDVVVLGAGNAGMAAARIARQAGRNVAIVESRHDVGDTCPLRGCLPKKVLVGAAEATKTIQAADRHAITVHGARMDWRRLIEHEQSLIAGTSPAFVESLEEQGIHLLHGEARFLGPHDLRVGDRSRAGSQASPKRPISTESISTGCSQRTIIRSFAAWALCSTRWASASVSSAGGRVRCGRLPKATERRTTSRRQFLESAAVTRTCGGADGTRTYNLRL